MSISEIEKYRQEILNSPHDPNAYYNLACVLIYTHGRALYDGQFSPEILAVLAEAKHCCEQALALMGNHGSAMMLLGQIHFFKNEMQEAEHWLLRGLQMDPHNQTWLTGADILAKVYMLSEKVDQAIVILEQLITYHPTYAPAYSKLEACRQFKQQSAAASAQKSMETLVQELQASIQAIMIGTGTPEEKATKIQALQSEFQTKIQKMYAA